MHQLDLKKRQRADKKCHIRLNVFTQLGPVVPIRRYHTPHIRLNHLQQASWIASNNDTDELDTVKSISYQIISNSWPMVLTQQWQWYHHYQ